VILYFDTSALIKRYLREPESLVVREAAATAAACVVCRIAWAEAMAVFARRQREMPADAAALERACRQLRADWPRFQIVEVTQTLVELAGDLADAFELRGYDSVHLAAAKTLHDASGGQVRFACFDARLQKAAKVLGMHVLP